MSESDLLQVHSVLLALHIVGGGLALASALVAAITKTLAPSRSRHRIHVLSGRVFYGGMVLSIYNNVQRALEDPRAQALAFRQAVREAQRFRQHLNAMITD